MASINVNYIFSDNYGKTITPIGNFPATLDSSALEYNSSIASDSKSCSGVIIGISWISDVEALISMKVIQP